MHANYVTHVIILPGNPFVTHIGKLRLKLLFPTKFLLEAFPCRLPWNFLVNFINERVGFGPSVSRFLSEDRLDENMEMQAELQ